MSVEFYEDIVEWCQNDNVMRAFLDLTQQFRAKRTLASTDPDVLDALRRWQPMLPQSQITQTDTCLELTWEPAHKEWGMILRTMYVQHSVETLAGKPLTPVSIVLKTPDLVQAVKDAGFAFQKGGCAHIDQRHADDDECPARPGAGLIFHDVFVKPYIKTNIEKLVATERFKRQYRVFQACSSSLPHDVALHVLPFVART